jgi:hypothetical protein
MSYSDPMSCCSSRHLRELRGQKPFSAPFASQKFLATNVVARHPLAPALLCPSLPKPEGTRENRRDRHSRCIAGP